MIVIESSYLIKYEDFQREKKEIHEQAKEGVIVVPPGFRVANAREAIKDRSSDDPRNVADMREKIQKLEQLLAEQEEPAASSDDLAEKIGATIHRIDQTHVQIQRKDGITIDFKAEKFKGNQWENLEMTLEELRLVAQIATESVQRRQKNEKD